MIRIKKNNWRALSQAAHSGRPSESSTTTPHGISTFEVMIRWVTNFKLKKTTSILIVIIIIVP